MDYKSLPPLFAISEVPLPLSRATIRRLIRRGILGHVRLGSRIFISLAQVQDFIRRGTRDGGVA